MKHLLKLEGMPSAAMEEILASAKVIKAKRGGGEAKPLDGQTWALIFTKSSSPILQLFSLLKLVRISRLGRIIERMNVTQDIKNALKLFKLIFVIIIYIHCLACLWFVIVKI